MRLFLRAGCALILCALLAIAATSPKSTGKKSRPDERFTVRTWLRTMTLRDKVAQLLIMPIYGEPAHRRSATSKKYDHFVRDLHVGGFIVTGHSMNGGIRNAEPYAMAALLNRMQKMSKLPLLVGADFERGASMRVNSTTPWPANMAFAAAQDLDGVFAEAAETARDARALGVNWIFAPVADVNNNPDNPIINIRSYGENPAQVSKFVRAYITGRAFRKTQPGAGHRQTFSRPWRHRAGQPSRLGPYRCRPPTHRGRRAGALSRRNCRRRGRDHDRAYRCAGLGARE